MAHPATTPGKKDHNEKDSEPVVLEVSADMKDNVKQVLFV